MEIEISCVSSRGGGSGKGDSVRCFSEQREDLYWGINYAGKIVGAEGEEDQVKGIWI